MSVSEVKPDKGPWKAAVSGGKVFVESDDFTHDVRLYVNGDFRDEAQNLAYAERLADQLNSILWLQSQNESQKIVIEGYESEINKLVRRIGGVWRNAITNTVSVVDMVSRRHSSSSRNLALSRFREDLEEMIERWFVFSRGVSPKSYEDAEKSWKLFLENDKKLKEKSQ